VDVQTVKYVHGSYLESCDFTMGVSTSDGLKPFRNGSNLESSSMAPPSTKQFRICWKLPDLPGAFSSQRHECQFGQLGARMLLPRDRGHGRWCRVGVVLEVNQRKITGGFFLQK
jgi:hypothetical protein